ncbi:anti-anti-sigma regulatory factor (antagonist of anti-sigma factor) [Mycolicibacterium chubuense NBB4]|uniref:Anti-anti-sigma regulatory factor (Antagonist of anti-sigma factor) n=1 Tax=Mycolicibacterium chubuense (strain NBB4) TaxID=710421 RepID=I4BNH3_MYCCN|nr:STAS domain-containing protein [Mycolicibacterium chubuense]AFM18830.1 anti-anti-sigma regulatory factor (antagonist of anti-sigma factor) [Mycolicibacterium chubuense NBB4]
MTVTSIRSRSADCRRFSVASTALTVVCRTQGRGADKEVTVSVSGEVDAANAKHFAHAVREAAGVSASVVLDLTDVNFMAFDGLSALYALSAHLSREDVTWCVVGSKAVSRVLELCDPEGLIPLATGIPTLRGAEPA